jgi:hypothetical protein
MKPIAATLLAAAAALLAGMLLLGAWLVTAAGGTANTSTCPRTAIATSHVPVDLATLFQRAADAYNLGDAGPAILAGLTKVESDFGRNMGPSSAGAIGWTQFMPDTWATFGTDGDGDGAADPYNAADAILSAARYLQQLGAPADWQAALFGYNHSHAYVAQVLDTARTLTALPVSSSPAAELDACLSAGGTRDVQRVVGGGQIVPIPGQPGQLIDTRILPDVLALQAAYHFTVTAGYAPTGHEAGGEHPLGLAVDLVPGPGGSWDQIDALARWAEPTQDHPRPPFRWVGYDGDAGHGRGNHLHLSWNHSPTPGARPPAAWVSVLTPPA